MAFLAHDGARADGCGRRSTPHRLPSGACARRGAPALVVPEGPDYPHEVHYLREWIGELHGRSGVGMAGVLPLSYTELDAWARRTGRNPLPHEVDALIRLDSVLCHPDAYAEPANG